jgi:hypothetical protein
MLREKLTVAITAVRPRRGQKGRGAWGAFAGFGGFSIIFGISEKREPKRSLSTDGAGIETKDHVLQAG